MVVVVTGSAGLIGSEAAAHYARRGYDVAGIDNDLRATFFGPDASTGPVREALEREHPRYRHFACDIRDRDAMRRIFGQFGRDIALVVHAAAQPSHDWAARDPDTDFSVNANGTLSVLEAVRTHCPDAPVAFTSTNKVYGDTPNRLPLVELERRWELDPSHPLQEGIDESMSLDDSTHSLFGVSKTAADLLVQEYGRYFGLKTACFRAGCLTGPAHAGAVLHGFLAYLLKCTCMGTAYTVFGYKGKQVRDNLHSADMVAAIDAFFQAPRVAAVYNIGGGRHCHCSMLEAIALVEEIAGRPLRWSYDPAARIGDHIWYVSDVRRFRRDYPSWQPRYTLRGLIEDIHEHNAPRWRAGVPST
ncbi:MAG: NAD-dependent epimerase/dehydratase family protein [Acidobacteriota bacterium]